MNAEEVRRAFKIRKTVLEMLYDRGYNVEKIEIDAKLEDFKAQFCPDGNNVNREQMHLCKAKRNNPADKIMVFFPEEAKVGATPLKAIYDQMKKEDVYHSILVAREGLTSFTKQGVAKMAAETIPRIVEVFCDKELLVNITKHMLVPKHTVLTKSEKAQLLERYKMKEGQLPRISTTDPVAKYYGMKRGEVVKIKRESETAGTYITYRLVV